MQPAGKVPLYIERLSVADSRPTSLDRGRIVRIFCAGDGILLLLRSRTVSGDVLCYLNKLDECGDSSHTDCQGL